MRSSKPILIANWKDKPISEREAGILLAGLAKKSVLFRKLLVFIAPPYTYFESVSKKVGGYAYLASQDVELITTGTNTGSISPEILKSFGIRLAILGHSERRVLGETDEVVKEKVKVALKAGITPLVCIGERERDADGVHLEFLRSQMKLSFGGLRRKEDAAKLAIAYEPIWAIGKRARDAVTPEDLAEIVLFIRKVLADMYGRKVTAHIPILYGGSVEPANAKNLLQNTGIKGFLVGHASLDAEKFAEIAEALTE